MLGSCTTVWSMARLASQTPAESGPRGWSVTGDCSGLLSRVYAPHLNLAPIFPGQAREELLRCALRMLMATPRKFCTHQVANFSFLGRCK